MRTTQTGQPGAVPLPSLERIEALVNFLDGSFGVPGADFRIPVDPLLGLIPVVGDGISLALSSIIILKARELGAPASLLGRMVVNVGIDFGVGSVPLMGDMFDVFYRANRKNFQLLKQWLESRANSGSAGLHDPALPPPQR